MSLQANHRDMQFGFRHAGADRPRKAERPRDELLDDILGDLNCLVEVGLLRPVYERGAIRWAVAPDADDEQ